MVYVLLITADPRHLLVLEQLVVETVEWRLVENIQEACLILDRSEEFPVLVLVGNEMRPDLAQLIRRTKKASRQKIPVVVMIEDLAQRSLVFEQGADDFLLLPLHKAEVNARIRQYLESTEIARMQAEVQITSDHTAWMLLITAFTAEGRRQDAIFSQIIQQIIHLMSADGGELWLLSEDGQSLYLATALFNSPFPIHRPRWCPKGKGWIGQAAERSETLVISKLCASLFPDLPPDFFPEELNYCSVLAISLRTKMKNVGVLALYQKHPAAFARHEIHMLEENLFLLSTQIANIQMMESLRRYAEQQHILYEMSQQISHGLDLHTTLNRATQWLGRLSDVEIGVIWLASEFGDRFEAAAVLGAPLPEMALVIENDDRIPDAGPVVLNDPAHEFYLPVIFSILDIIPLNVLVLPMKQRGKMLGMVTLFNKISGPFEQVEIGLLMTAIEMIAISISNAKLFTQTITLIEERERLHKQAIQTERLRTIGRLTASLAHEVNNPMQAIRGALTLALEDIDNPEELKEYLTLSLQETDRVVKLVSRMRQLYHPSSDQMDAIQVTNLLREVFEISKDELNGQRVKITPAFPLHSPIIYGIANQIHLAFLSILLSLLEAMGTVGGGVLAVSVHDLRTSVKVEFATQTPIGAPLGLEQSVESNEHELRLQEPIYGLSPVIELLSANSGKMDILRQDGKTILKVEFSKGAAF
jgi:GAF domain-containing protein